MGAIRFFGLTVTKTAASLHTSLVSSTCIGCPSSPLLRMECTVLSLDLSFVGAELLVHASAGIILVEVGMST